MKLRDIPNNVFVEILGILRDCALDRCKEPDMNEELWAGLEREIETEYSLAFDNMRHLELVSYDTNRLPFSGMDVERYKLMTTMIDRCVNNMFRTACIYNMHFDLFLVTMGGIILVKHWPLIVLKDAFVNAKCDVTEGSKLYEILKDVTSLRIALIKMLLWKKSIMLAKRKYYCTTFNLHSNNFKKTWRTINEILNGGKGKSNLPLTFKTKQGDFITNEK